MVRHGRLSKGCENCRKRKIKCDQARPSCSQCLKSGWNCPQYGDSLERMFQSCNVFDFENAESLRYDNPACVKTPRISCQPVCCEPDVAHDNWLAFTGTTTKQKRASLNDGFPYSVTLLRGIDQHLDCRAIDFFFATQVFREPDHIRGYYEYLPAFVTENAVNERLSKSLKAVALAVYALNFRCINTMNTARRYYGQAIRLINDAFSSTTEATEDSTVISILLLGTFENVTSESIRCLKSTKAHMLGAMAVLNMRGNQQFESRHRLQMFQQMCTCLYFACVMCSLYIPPELIKLRRFSAKFLDIDDPSWKLSEAMERVAGFRANVQNCFYKDAGNVVEAALKIDTELTSIAIGMPDSWLFQTISVSSNSDVVFDTHYHAYPDLWIASTWNNLRTCRLLLHEEIRHQFDMFPLLTASSQLTVNHISAKISQQMIDEICAAIPQFCEGLAMPPDHPEVLTYIVKNGIPTTAAIYYLMWPIMNMKGLINSDTQRDWIVNRVRSIGKSAGMRQAFEIADFLESKRSLVF